MVNAAAPGRTPGRVVPYRIIRRLGAGGMGGHAAGEVASSMAVHVFRETLHAERATLEAFERAADDYTDAISLDQEYAIAYSNRGYALMELGEDDDAVEDFEMYLELRPDASDAADIEDLIDELS